MSRSPRYLRAAVIIAAGLCSVGRGAGPGSPQQSPQQAPSPIQAPARKTVMVPETHLPNSHNDPDGA